MLQESIKKKFCQKKKICSKKNILFLQLWRNPIGPYCAGLITARPDPVILSLSLRMEPGQQILGSKKYKEDAELKNNSIDFEKFQLKEKTSDKYLRQVSESNLASSALASVKDRVGKIKGAAIEIKAIIEEYEMQALAGAMAFWELWEHALLPSLLSGVGTWLGEIKETVDLGDSLQNFFWRLILEVPESCPKVYLRSKTNMIGAKWRIREAKCLLLKQIQLLEDTALAKTVRQEAEARGWPGLNQEVREICKQVGMQDTNKHNISKSKIKEAIFYSQELFISKKLEEIQKEDYRTIQPYFKEKSIENTRLAFRIRTKIVSQIPGNFKNMYKNTENGLNCSHCSEPVMAQSHCISCPGMAELRDGLELSEINGMMTFFRRVRKERDKK